MAKAAPPQTLIIYLLTEPTVIGAIAWVGLLIGIPSLWIAIRQLKKVRRASDASTEAIRNFKVVVREHDIISSLGLVVTGLTGAIGAIERKNYEAAVLHLDASNLSLVDAREIGDESLRHATDIQLTNLRSERHLLSGMPVGVNLTGRALTVARRLRLVQEIIEEQLAKSRFKHVRDSTDGRVDTNTSNA